MSFSLSDLLIFSEFKLFSNLLLNSIYSKFILFKSSSSFIICSSLNFDSSFKLLLSALRLIFSDFNLLILIWIISLNFDNSSDFVFIILECWIRL